MAATGLAPPLEPPNIEFQRIDREHALIMGSASQRRAMARTVAIAGEARIRLVTGFASA